MPTDDKKQDKATRAVDKLIERDRQNREQSAQIFDYYKDLKQKGERI